MSETRQWVERFEALRDDLATGDLYHVQKWVQNDGALTEIAEGIARLTAELDAAREALTIANTTAANLHDVIRRKDREMEEATEALRDAFGAICPGYAYESPRQAARTIVNRYVRTENVLLEEIDGLRTVLDAVRERERECREALAEVGIPLEAFWMAMHDSPHLASEVREAVQRALSIVRRALATHPTDRSENDDE